MSQTEIDAILQKLKDQLSADLFSQVSELLLRQSAEISEVKQQYARIVARQDELTTRMADIVQMMNRS